MSDILSRYPSSGSSGGGKWLYGFLYVIDEAHPDGYVVHPVKLR